MLLLQGYLKEFNEFYEELEGKKVGIFGICAEPDPLPDQAVQEWGLKYKVMMSSLDIKLPVLILYGEGEGERERILIMSVAR